MKNNECPVHKEGGPVCICASELSRVRGLLQRAISAANGRWEEWGDRALAVKELLDEATQGAESADIGKLDTADNKDLQIVRVLRACGKTMNGGQFENFVTHIVIPLVEHHWPGSAETGGEKAAPHGILAAIYKLTKKPDFEQMLGNLLARIHRDGGHYIADHGWDRAVEDADKKIVEWLVLSESREPEKLNNAQKCTNCGRLEKDEVHSEHGTAGGTWHPFSRVALAESSLSKTIDATGDNPSF